MSATMSETKNTARRVAYSPAVETLARIGYGVRGLLYGLMGILSLNIIFGKGGQAPSPQGAIATIGQQPAGKALLWGVLIGFVGYAIWSLVKALFDPLHKGAHAKGLLVRLGFLVSAVSYSFLAWTTYGFLRGTGSTSSNASSAKFLSQLMVSPSGRVIVMLIGVVVICVGIYNIIKALRRGFQREFQTYALTSEEVRIVTNIGRFGTAARGVVFTIIGGLIVWAGYTSNASQPVGVDSAIATLLKQPYGPFLVGLVGLGLIAFGFYSLLSAAWFRLRRSN